MGCNEGGTGSTSYARVMSNSNTRGGEGDKLCTMARGEGRISRNAKGGAKVRGGVGRVLRGRGGSKGGSLMEGMLGQT